MDRNDELTAIRGIGEARARRLRDELGIRSLRELAQTSADELERGLHEVGISGTSRAGIEAWIDQARELVAGADEKGAPAPVNRPDPARPSGPPNGDGRWRAEAVFMVELQSEAGGDRWRTTVHHMEADTGDGWAGFDCDRLCAWLSARSPEALREDSSPPPEEAVGTAPSPVTPSAGSDAQVAQPLSVTVEADVIDGSVAQPVGQIALGAPWAVDVRWTLAEALSADAGGEWLIRASFEPMGTGEPLGILDEPTRLPPRPSESSYRHRMDVPAGVVTSAHSGPTYCGVVVLTFEPDRAGVAPGAWFVDLRPIQFHEPSH